MHALRWNYEMKNYEAYELPPFASAYESDMDTPIECASCSKLLAFGDGYTSRQIHSAHGFGYAVCGKCYEKEWKMERKYDQND